MITQHKRTFRRVWSSSFQRVALVATLLATTLSTRGAAAQTVVHVAQRGTLADQFEWSVVEGVKGGRTFWFGYSIDRLQTGTVWYGSNDSVEHSLATLLGQGIAGNDEAEVEELARRTLDGLAGTERQEESRSTTAILLKLSVDTKRVVDVEIRSIEQGSPIGDDRLFWAGKVTTETAAAFAFSRYAATDQLAVRESLVDAIGILDGSRVAYGHLTDIYEQADSPDVRKKAIFWIGRHGSVEAYAFVRRALQSDQSANVREHAVFVMSRFDHPGAVDDLIAVAGADDDDDIRQAAQFWASRRIATELVGNVSRQESEFDGVQRQALFALMREYDAEGVGLLVDLARTAESQSLRREAIHMLGHVENELSLSALVALHADR